MDDDVMTRRRKFLAGASLTGATLLAGCSGGDGGDGNTTEPLANSTDDGNQDDGDDGTDNSTDDGTDGGTDDGTNDQEDWPEPGEGERVVGVVSGVDQQSIQQLQTQLQQGEITQEEYRTQAGELVEAGLQELRDAIAADTAVTVQDQLVVGVQFVGALRIFGDPDELIDVVNLEQARSLVAVESYDQLSADLEESA